MNRTILVLIAITFAISGAFAQEVTKGTFTDPRDGHVYPTISFDDFLTASTTTWMASNLDYKVYEGCWAYDNQEKYRTKLGLLYTWEVAKEVCPNGWHLPTDTEWQTLINYFGGDDKAGIALKSTQGWESADESVKGTNSSGFSALPGGQSNHLGNFSYLGKTGTWWSATESSEHRALRRELSSYSSEVELYHGHPKSWHCSVRCVKD